MSVHRRFLSDVMEQFVFYYGCVKDEKSLRMVANGHTVVMEFSHTFAVKMAKLGRNKKFYDIHQEVPSLQCVEKAAYNITINATTNMVQRKA